MQNQAANTAALWDQASLEHCDPDLKILAHKLAAEQLQQFATDVLLLELSEFEVRSNMGGIAGSGEVTLHTDAIDEGHSVYIQINQCALGVNHSIMWRSCRDRKDYAAHGHINRWGSVTDLLASEGKRARFGRLLRIACRK